MQISENGARFICGFEGFRAFPYQDVKGVWTIGYGTTVYPNGFKVTANDIAITQQQAMECMRYHVDKIIAKWLNKSMAQLALTQNQFDALCCFIYNVGVHAFEQSTLLKDIKKMAAGGKHLWDSEVITADFMMWVKSGGMLVSGLVKRRRAEAELFLSVNG